MYSVSRIMIKEQHPLYSYCMETTAASKRLYNAALFRIRNRFTGYRKVAPLHTAAGFRDWLILRISKCRMRQKRLCRRSRR